MLITPDGPLVLLKDSYGAVPEFQHADRVFTNGGLLGLDAICPHCMELMEFLLAIPDSALSLDGELLDGEPPR